MKGPSSKILTDLRGKEPDAVLRAGDGKTLLPPTATRERLEQMK